MAGTTAEVRGGAKCARAFARMHDRLDDMRSVHAEAASVVAERARHNAPKVSGALADSIRVEDADDGATVVAGDGQVPYAGPIHFGWRERNIEPQPFLTDALDDSADDVRAKYDDAVGDVVRKFDRDAP